MPASFDLDLGMCVYCGFCVEVCPEDAIRMDTQILDIAAYSREGMKLDMNAVLEAAAETKTIVELNCTPSRMDLDWRYWKSATQKGVLCVIDPDAHATGELEQVRMGVNVARKGWLTPATVLNTRKLADVEQFLRTPKPKRVMEPGARGR